jgi:S-adenosylmethionine uptake transporter
VRRLVGLGEPEWRLVFYFALNSAFYALLVMLFSKTHGHTAPGVGMLLLVGLFGTLGQWCLSRAFGRGHVLMSASLQYSGVVFAAVFGVVLWGEVLPLQSWIGIAIISAAGILATVATRRGKPAVEAA